MLKNEWVDNTKAEKLRLMDEAEVIYNLVRNERKTFYPYKEKESVSVEAEVIYNVARNEKEVFYIDVGQLTPSEVEAFLLNIRKSFNEKRITK